MQLISNRQNSPFIQSELSLLLGEGPVGDGVKGHTEGCLIHRDSNFVIKGWQ